MGNQLVSIYYQVSQHTRATPNSALSSSYTASRTFTSRSATTNSAFRRNLSSKSTPKQLVFSMTPLASNSHPKKCLRSSIFAAGPAHRGWWLPGTHAESSVSNYRNRLWKMLVSTLLITRYTHNAEFIAGRVEKLFKPIMGQLEISPDIAVIVNPTRGGVGKYFFFFLNHILYFNSFDFNISDRRIISLLRENERVRNLVYISCQADGPAMNNFVDLCHRPTRRTTSEPFVLKRAIPIDLFPHTNHCELILSFRRWPSLFLYF